MGGDLNLCYSDVVHAGPSNFYSAYREANGMPQAPPGPWDNCHAYNGQPYYTVDARGGNYTRKLDYSFGRLSDFSASSIGRYGYPESDHALIVGVFTRP